MFPYPHDSPAEFAQFPIHAAVASLVRGEFLFPECTVAGGDFAMLGTAMPETAVHEECQPVPPKKKIRFAENILIPTPAGDAVAAQQFHQGEFRLFVAPSANPGHDIGALCLGEHVSHVS